MSAASGEPGASSPGYSRELIPYFVVTAFLSIGYGSVLTLLGDIRDRFGLSGGQVGIIAGAGFLAGFVAQTGLARFADRGHAALMVRTVICIGLLGALLCAFAETFALWAVARLCIGLGSGMVGPAVRRVVIAKDPERVGANLGVQGAFEIAGFIVGPVLAGVLAEVTFRAPFVVLAVIDALLLLWVVRLDLDGGVAASHKGSVRALLRLPAMQAALFASIAFYITIGMFEAVMSPMLKDLGASTWLIGVTFSVFTLPMVPLAPFGGKLAQRRGPMNVIVYSIFVALLCTLSYGFGPLWLVLVVSIVHACADSFTMPGNQVAVAMASPPDQLATGQGLLGSVGLLVAGLMGVIGGSVYESLGRVWLFSLTASAMAVMLALVLWRGRPQIVRSRSTSAPTHS